MLRCSLCISLDVAVAKQSAKKCGLTWPGAGIYQRRRTYGVQRCAIDCTTWTRNAPRQDRTDECNKCTRLGATQWPHNLINNQTTVAVA